MRIGIDARLYTQTGVGRYLKNLLLTLSQIDQKNEYIIYLRKQEFHLFDTKNPNWKKKLLDIPWHTFSEQMYVPLQMMKDNLDVAHFPYFNVPIFYSKKYLLTIHDLIVDHFDTGRASTLPAPLYWAKRLGYSLATNWGAKRASRITVISQTTKQEVINHYHVPSEKLHVTFDALDMKFKETVLSTRPKRLITGAYILYVGNAYPHKNLERLCQAFGKIQKKQKIKLVFAGDDSYFYPRLKVQAKKLGLERELIFFGNANDTQLYDLYSFCTILVFPSLMEGFGLPNLEALYCHKLPVLSDIPVFREIWGDTLPFFDPYSVEKIADKLTYALNLSPEKYNTLVSLARKNVDLFTWIESAKKTLTLYEEIVKE